MPPVPAALQFLTENVVSMAPSVLDCVIHMDGVAIAVRGPYAEVEVLKDANDMNSVVSIPQQSIDLSKLPRFPVEGDRVVYSDGDELLVDYAKANGAGMVDCRLKRRR